MQSRGLQSDYNKALETGSNTNVPTQDRNTGWDHDTNNPQNTLQHGAPHFAQERITQILFRICNCYIILVDIMKCSNTYHMAYNNFTEHTCMNTAAKCKRSFNGVHTFMLHEAGG